jgi:integrase
MLSTFLSGLRPNSRRVYNRVIKEFKEVTGLEFEAITLRTAEAYLARVISSGLSDNSKKLKSDAARAMCSYLTDMGILASNPMTRLRRTMRIRQRAQRRPTALIPFAMVAKIVGLPSLQTAKGVRDRALLCTLFGCALRRSELMALNVGDVMLDAQGTPFFQLSSTKGGSLQRQPMPSWVAEAIGALVAQRKAEGAADNDALFINYRLRSRKRVTEWLVYRTFRGYCKQVGINASPHAARATAATYLANEGHNEVKIAQFLRHADTQQVATYVKLSQNLRENLGAKINY